MKPIVSLAILGTILLLSGGCRSVESPVPQISEARRLILDGKAECVLLRGNAIYAQERGHGVSPLLLIYRHRRDDMKDATVVDKVIGRAAAAIAICGKVRHVHGEIMSEDAVEFLHKNGISVSHTLLVPRILNRRRDGLCPLEQSVEGIDDPAQAVATLERKIATLSKPHSSEGGKKP